MPRIRVAAWQVRECSSREDLRVFDGAASATLACCIGSADYGWQNPTRRLRRADAQRRRRLSAAFGCWSAASRANVKSGAAKLSRGAGRFCRPLSIGEREVRRRCACDTAEERPSFGSGRRGSPRQARAARIYLVSCECLTELMVYDSTGTAIAISSAVRSKSKT